MADSTTVTHAIARAGAVDWQPAAKRRGRRLCGPWLCCSDPRRGLTPGLLMGIIVILMFRTRDDSASCESMSGTGPSARTECAFSSCATDGVSIQGHRGRRVCRGGTEAAAATTC